MTMEFIGIKVVDPGGFIILLKSEEHTLNKIFSVVGLQLGL